jgi:hypothetical protein
MDPRMFEKSPTITPLLVQIYDKQKSNGMLNSDDPLVRNEITDAVIELLEVSHLNQREELLISDVLIGLISRTKTDMRKSLSERLSVIDGIPLPLVLHLVNDEDFGVVSPVLRHSSVLGDMDLIYIIKSKDSKYWQEIAKRTKLSSDVINVLTSKRDTGTAINLVRNKSIILPEASIGVMAEMARESSILASNMIIRQELPKELIKEVYKYVGQDLKDMVAAHASGNIRELVEDDVEDITVSLVEQEERIFMPTERMTQIADRFARRGILNIERCMSAIHRNHIASFIALFARYTGISSVDIHDSLKSYGGRNLALICRAYGIQKRDFSSIYLLTERVRSDAPTVDQKAFNLALRNFDRIRPEVAQRLLGFGS